MGHRAGLNAVEKWKTFCPCQESKTDPSLLSTPNLIVILTNNNDNNNNNNSVKFWFSSMIAKYGGYENKQMKHKQHKHLDPNKYNRLA